MDVLVRVELCGHIFPLVFEGPPWTHYVPSDSAEATVERRDVAREHHVAELRIDDSSSLRRILNLAADEFGIRLADSAGGTVADVISGVGFYEKGDEAATDLPQERFTRRLPMVDEQGRLWIVDFREATLAGLCRASAANLLDGDVLHPYLRPTVPQGDAVSVEEWGYVVQAFQALWAVFKDLEPLGTPAAILSMMGMTLPLWKKLIRRRARPLVERGVRPGELRQLLARRTWDGADAARLLAMTEEQAAEFLRALGYEEDAHGAWRDSQSVPSQLERLSVDIVSRTEHITNPAVRASEVAKMTQVAVRIIRETGDCPSVRDLDKG